jgi:hypothetical protein
MYIRQAYNYIGPYIPPRANLERRGLELKYWLGGSASGKFTVGWDSRPTVNLD